MPTPLKYNPAYHDDWAWSLAIKGATDQDIADAFHVSRRTIIRWRQTYPSFNEACQHGKEVADAKVKRSLYERAVGFEYQEKVNGAGHLKAVPVDALPAPSEANADTIYFLRKNNSEAGKQYRAYKLIHGIFEIVGSAEVDLTGYVQQKTVEKADDSIIKSIYSSMISPAEKYLGSGNLLLFWTMLKELLNGHESNINDLLARVKLLELILSADVTGNPYYVTFNTLTDVVVSSGIWNEADGRIEF